MQQLLYQETNRIKKGLEPLKCPFYVKTTGTTIYGQVSEPLGADSNLLREHLEKLLSSKNSTLIYLEKNGINIHFHINKKQISKTKNTLTTKFKITFSLSKPNPEDDRWWDNF